MFKNDFYLYKLMKKRVLWEDLLLVIFVIGMVTGISIFGSFSISTNPKFSFFVNILTLVLVYLFFAFVVLNYFKKKKNDQKKKKKMTKFFKVKRKVDPYTRAVADVMNRVNKKVTPSEIAEYLRIHPNTAKNRILKLRRQGYIKCEKSGKKLFCSRKKKFPLY